MDQGSNGSESRQFKGLTVNPVVGCKISPGCGGGYQRTGQGQRRMLGRIARRAHEQRTETAHVSRPRQTRWRMVWRRKLVPGTIEGYRGRQSAQTQCSGVLAPPITRVRFATCRICFHDKVPFQDIAAVFGAMACTGHLFYVLTDSQNRRSSFGWLSLWQDDDGHDRPAAHLRGVSRLVRGHGDMGGHGGYQPWPLLTWFQA